MDQSPKVPVSRKSKLVLLGLGLVVSLVAFEVAVRLAGSLVKPERWSDRPYAFFLPSDSYTLQDSKRHPKQPGDFRIAVVGDSFTFGPHMQLTDTFPKKLEQMLNTNVGAPKVEVLNRGHNGASTFVETELVRLALEESPDLLILEITLNDAEPHPLTPEERAAVYQPKWLTWRIFSWWKSLGMLAKRIHNSQTVQNYVDYHQRFFKEPEPHAAFASALKRIAAQAAEAKVPVVAVVFPLFDFPINEQYPFTETHEIIRRDLEAAGIRSVDLTRAYRSVPPERLQVIPGADNHPNEIAHRIAAERILAALGKEQLVPPATLPTHVYRARTDIKSKPSDPARIWPRASRIVLDSKGEDGAHGEGEESAH
jgi:hypothetical protein